MHADVPPDEAIEIVTFGCRLNIVESDRMRRLAAQAGQTRLTIVNTCAVTAEATRQARQAIRRERRERPDRTIVVTGCAAETDAASFRAMPEVDRLIGNRVKTDPATWGLLGGALPPAAPAEVASTHTRGFVEVQNGCDHRCTFCVIPFGRGASRSVPVDAVVERVRAMVGAGLREVVLTGVDITSYGGDLPDRLSLGGLVRAILAGVPVLDRLRLSSLDCIEADPALLQAVADEPRLMPHLHLSLQSGSDLVLKRMKRRHNRAEAIAFCDRLRRARPDIVLGADIITGFPTESEAMFDDSLSLVEACGLTHLHVFPYSARPGTPAARMPQVPRDVARERAGRLRASGERALCRHLDAQVGRRLRVLMERGGKGRSADFTAVRPDHPCRAGDIVDVMITGHDGTTLSGSSAAPDNRDA